MRKKPKRTGEPKPSVLEFLTSAGAFRREVGEERWAQEDLEARASLAQMVSDAMRQFAEFDASDEGRAREEMRVGLELLLANEVIAKSPVCIQVLTAFQQCVNYQWGAKDSAEMVAPLAPHFNKVRASTSAKAKAEKTAEMDAPYRALLRQHPGSKPSVQRALLRDRFGLTHAETLAVARRWRDSEEGKKSTAASTRQSATAKDAHKDEAPP